jgi:AcrR family transcriptional regulator
MAQYLKDDVRERIERAALVVFARDGVRAATMAAIAKRAGVSAGNIYHYYPAKDALHAAVIPEAFVRRFERLIRDRVRSLRGVADIGALGPRAPFHALAEDLLAFSMRHRLEVVVLLGRSAGTGHAGFAAHLVRVMQRLAVAHARSLGGGGAASPAVRAALDRIYRHWVASLVEILETHTAEPAIREAVAAYARYHLAGLAALLEVNVP